MLEVTLLGQFDVRLNDEPVDLKSQPAQLKETLRFNACLPDYFLGAKRLPRDIPPYMSFGDENEAAHYATEASHLWLQEKGAVDWLRQVSSEM
jgi:hypothetical protein